MKTKRKKGFTLIEVLIAVSAGVIVVLATGMALFTGHTSWNNAWKKANLQRDASYAMLRISGTIKAAGSATIDDDGSAIDIQSDHTTTRFFRGQTSGSLICQIAGQYPETIINGKVENLQFNVEGNKVEIDLKLKEDSLQTRLVSTIMMRNYGG